MFHSSHRGNNTFGSTGFWIDRSSSFLLLDINRSLPSYLRMSSHLLVFLSSINTALKTSKKKILDASLASGGGEAPSPSSSSTSTCHIRFEIESLALPGLSQNWTFDIWKRLRIWTQPIEIAFFDVAQLNRYVKTIIIFLTLSLLLWIFFIMLKCRKVLSMLNGGITM